MSNRPRAVDGREQTTQTLSKAHLAPNRTLSAKEMVYQAVNILDAENEELKRENATVLSQLEHLKQENQQLRKELEDCRQKRVETEERVCLLDKENKSLAQELEKQITFYQHETRKISQAEVQLSEENAQFRKQVELLKDQLFQKDNEVKGLSKDVKTLQRQFERNVNPNLSDRDFELMHEMESLKTERKDLIHDRDELARTTTKLRNDYKNLEIQLDEKVAELKNENRRHSLLTKEFNSLLEENSHLKLQLRRRNQRLPLGANAAGSSRDDSSASVTLSDTTPLRVPPKQSSSLSLTKDGSFLAHDNRGTLRETSLNSRDRRISRETITSTGSTRDSNSTYYAQPHSSSRDLAAGGKRASRELAGVEYAGSTSPDTLPSISGSTKTGTWKP